MESSEIKPPFILLRDDGVRAFDSIVAALRAFELQDIEGWPTIGVDVEGRGLRLIVDDYRARLMVDISVWRELMTSETVEDQLIEFLTIINPGLGLHEDRLKLWSVKDLIQRVFEVVVAQGETPVWWMMRYQKGRWE